jgi:glycerol-3-phosphate acyltransferase PlsY
MRAAGFWAGFATATLDMLKAASTVWIARALAPGEVWVHVLAPVLAILGHNYSIFLVERDERGRIRLRGGAGGAPATGGAFGLWAPSILIIVPLAALILFGIGYASVATISVALIAAVIFAVRAALDQSPWQYVAYGLLAEILLVWALRPNIRRLIEGKERMIGWRARRKKKAQEKNYSSSSSSSSNS